MNYYSLISNLRISTKKNCDDNKNIKYLVSHNLSNIFNQKKHYFRINFEFSICQISFTSDYVIENDAIKELLNTKKFTFNFKFQSIEKIIIHNGSTSYIFELKTPPEFETEDDKNLEVLSKIFCDIKNKEFVLIFDVESEKKKETQLNKIIYKINNLVSVVN